MGTGAGLDSATRLGGTWTKDGLGTAPSEASGTDADNLETVRPHEIWQPADTTPANSRLRYVADAEFDLGEATVAGLKGIGQHGVIRLRADRRFMEKPAAGLVSGKTAVDITEPTSWTVSVLCRAQGSNLLAATDDICELRNHTTTSSSTTRLVQVAVGAAGNPLIRLERFGGAPNEKDFTSAARIDDAAWHWIDVSFDGSGGGPFTATSYLDGTSIGTDTTSEALGPETMTLSKSANHHVAGLWFFNRALTAAELTIFRYSLRDGAETDLECGLNFSETSGTNVADSTGGHAMTLSGDTWTTAQNPGAEFATVAEPVWHAWSRRDSLVCVEAGAGTVESGTSLAASPLVHVMFLIRSKTLPPTATTIIGYFGTASTVTNFDWMVMWNADGTIRFRTNRFAAGLVDASTTTNCADGEVHRVSLRISWANAISVAVNGTEEATGTATAHIANGSSKMVLHHGTANFEVAGPFVASRRTYTHAEADAILRGTAPIIPTGSSDGNTYLYYPLTEGTGNPANHGTAGSAGDLTITSSAASWSLAAIANPDATGAYLAGDLSEIDAPCWTTRSGLSANVRALEVLLEIFDPEATTISVGALLLWDMLWPSIDATTGAGTPGGVQLVGPGVMDNPAHVPASDGIETSDMPALALDRLTDDELRDVMRHVAESVRTQDRDGSAREMRPMLIYIDRVAFARETAAGLRKRHLQHIDCAVITPELQRSVETDARGTFRQSYTLGGQRRGW